MTAAAASLAAPVASRRARTPEARPSERASSSALAVAPPETEQLLVAAAAGDQEAFASLYDRLAPQVVGVALRVLRDRALAEEVAQEVFVELWRKADRFDPERGTATGWVATLTHRRAVDRVRSEQAARDRDHRVQRRDEVRAFDDVSDAVERRLDHWQVRQALAVLSDRQREAVELAYFQGHTYREVAHVLGIPEGTAKSRLRDALLRLRGSLEGLV
jgi:RNA polymerase sigma-70 factor, ECF subfamily